MGSLWQDVRYGARNLRRTPGFTFVVIATLALGIGANTAIFSIVNAVLLRPLPFPDPDRLAVLWETRTSQQDYFMFASPPNYADWRAQQQSFDEIAAFRHSDFFLAGPDETLRVHGARVTASLFRTLRVQPMLGRAFGDGDDGSAAERVAIISEGLWRDRFGADPRIVGRQLDLADGSYTIVGVMAAGFDFPPPIDLEGRSLPRKSDLWIPFANDMTAGQRGAHYLTVIGRLSEGTTHAAAEADLRAIAGRLERAYPGTNADWSALVVPFEEVVTGDVRLGLLVLLGAVGAVLLIACVNIANLLLARATGRAREYAIRAALGAGRARLVRLSIVESLLLALAGGAAALGLAWASLGALVRVAPQDVPRLASTSIDGGVIAFTLAIALLAGLLFGVAPAVRVFAPDVAQWLRAGTRNVADARSRVRDTLVVAEIALSLVLLAGAGLLFDSFLALRGVDAGFDAASVLTMRISLPAARYNDDARIAAAWGTIEEQVAAVPGVDAAGLVLDLPLISDYQGTMLLIEGVPDPEPDEFRGAHFSAATPGYFDAMGIPLLSGRAFDARDVIGGTPTILVNQELVRRYFGGSDPIGRRITSFGAPRTIVGVVGDVRLEDLARDPTPAMYLPELQAAYDAMSLVIRTRSDPAPMLDAVRARLRAIDPRIPIYDVRTMRDVVSYAVSQPRFSSLMLAIFSAVALTLAAVGIYGVISYAVGQRTREIGIRMAMGARPGDATRMVVREGAKLVAVGVPAGLVGALGLTRFLRSLLYGVSPTEPLTLGAASAFLIGVALLASWLPARRASRVHPMEALRTD